VPDKRTARSPGSMRYFARASQAADLEPQEGDAVLGLGGAVGVLRVRDPALSEPSALTTSSPSTDDWGMISAEEDLLPVRGTQVSSGSGCPLLALVPH
jgi:hypothetical protein